jgi:NAD(P)-dependent dehydrogenase (short-subunit alcohol dehydrogenase family)
MSGLNMQAAIVTGAGQGIGRAVALKLAAHAVHVILAGRTRAKLEGVAAEIAAAGGSSTIHALDVSEGAQVSALLEAVQGQFSHIDMLINCAGEAHLAPIEETAESDWERILAINLKAPFLLARAFLCLLRNSPNPNIINLSSKVALQGYGSVTAYSAAKAGLVGLTRSLAKELLGEAIRVVALCPGPVDTPMRWAATPDFDPKVVISAETVAATVWYIVNLPRGVTTGDILLQSMHYD